MSKSVTLSSLICCCEYSGYSQKYLRKITGFCSHFGICVSARGGLATSKGDRNTVCEKSSKWISNKYLQNFICWNSFTLNGNFWNWKCGKLWLSVAKAVVEGGKKKKKLISINWHLWIVFTDSTRAMSEPILVIGFAVDLKQHDCLHHLCELAPFSSWLLQTFSQL